ncbi:MAG: 2-hydroxy-6-oxo-2,4-heptadienoate hydrolase [Chromatiales bacterium]|jgi:pimeloyl-ACP methyl ester carboxylesterase|nr:2-hydroxy-6-oxo-2,4-heptadienoate hydrolase [Chromatiales bacterium]MDH4015337.1 2-hydroxy-6-oxo-2,4-heptadienoate hydrolase [Chromatiales bacterium]
MAETASPNHNPEIGAGIDASGLVTNYHDAGSGKPVVLPHGSAPAVTAWANWRLTIPELAPHHHVLAPDITGFDYTDNTADDRYDLAIRQDHLITSFDAPDLVRIAAIDASIGGAPALAVNHPQRVERLVLMGAAELDFALTPGLDAVWGYQPSLENMRALMHLLAWDRHLISDDLVQMRYQASEGRCPAKLRRDVPGSAAVRYSEPRPGRGGCRGNRPPGPDRAWLRRQDDSAGDQFAPAPADSAVAIAVFGHRTPIEHADRCARLVNDFQRKQ